MCKVEMKNSEPVSTKETTEIMVNILDINYTKTYLEHVVVNSTHMNDYDITQLLGILNGFEDLFDGTLR